MASRPAFVLPCWLFIVSHVCLLVCGNGSEQKILHFNNDLTNTRTCTSPFHQQGGPFTSTVLNGSISETKGLGISTHLLAPGLGWVPWWNSSIVPPEQHSQWMKSQFNLSDVDSGDFFAYVLRGGDILEEFITTATIHDMRPSLSFRISDTQFCKRPISSLYEDMSQFWYDHRHEASFMVFGNTSKFNDTCCFLGKASWDEHDSESSCDAFCFTYVLSKNKCMLSIMFEHRKMSV